MKNCIVKLKPFLGLFFTLFFLYQVQAQTITSEKPKINIKPVGVIQVWSRYLQYNPGSTVNNQEINEGLDFSIRRYRLGISASITPQWYFTFVLGENNLNVNSDLGKSFGVLDFLVEYRWKKQFQFGAGKSSWRGLSRYAAPSTSKQFGFDIPGVAIATINRQDHLLRKLGVYAKGQVSKLDYRVAVASPFLRSTTDIQEGIATESYKPGTLNYSGYVKWEFFEMESNSSAYSIGSYLGTKKVLAVGLGTEYQKDAYWLTNSAQDTVYQNMFLNAVDVFFELPLNTTKRNAITMYTAGYFYDYGQNFVRNLGLNSPSSTVNGNGTFSGSGNAYPTLGTGNSLFFQAAYLFPLFKNEKNGQLQVYGSFQYSDYDQLADKVLMYNGGVAWYLKGHLSKFTLSYQSRPVFDYRTAGIEEVDRLGEVVLQYQFRFE